MAVDQDSLSKRSAAEGCIIKVDENRATKQTPALRHSLRTLGAMNLDIAGSLAAKSGSPLSAAGLRGRCFLGRRTNISWADPTAIAPVSPPRLWGMPGITMLKLDKEGIPLHFGSVFIPRAILQEPTFRAALQSYAPHGHVLLGRVDR
jgi:hypothetical protein